MKEECENCRYFYVLHPHKRIILEVIKCRRYPPQTSYEGYYQPSIKRNDYCGEFRVKEVDPTCYQRAIDKMLKRYPCR